MDMTISKSATKHSSTKSNKDFLGLNDSKRYPKTVKLFNFYTRKYVYLSTDNDIDELDINWYHRCDYFSFPYSYV